MGPGFRWLFLVVADEFHVCSPGREFLWVYSLASWLHELNALCISWWARQPARAAAACTSDCSCGDRLQLKPPSGTFLLGVFLHRRSLQHGDGCEWALVPPPCSESPPCLLSPIPPNAAQRPSSPAQLLLGFLCAAPPCAAAVTCLHQPEFLGPGYIKFDMKKLINNLKKSWPNQSLFFFFFSVFLPLLGIIPNGAINFSCVQYKNSKWWKYVWFNVWLKFQWSQTGQVCQSHYWYGPSFMPIIVL